SCAGRAGQPRVRLDAAGDPGRGAAGGDLERRADPGHARVDGEARSCAALREGGVDALRVEDRDGGSEADRHGEARTGPEAPREEGLLQQVLEQVTRARDFSTAINHAGWLMAVFFYSGCRSSR